VKPIRTPLVTGIYESIPKVNSVSIGIKSLGQDPHIHLVVKSSWDADSYVWKPMACGGFISRQAKADLDLWTGKRRPLVESPKIRRNRNSDKTKSNIRHVYGAAPSEG